MSITDVQIREAYKAFPDHKTQAAQSLGINPSTYTYRLKLLGLNTRSRTGPKSSDLVYRTESELQELVLRGSKLHPLSMKRAADSVGLSYRVFKRQATLLGLFKPNPSRKGLPRPASRTCILECLAKGTKDSGSSIKARLIRDGHKIDRCEVCNLSPEWNGRVLSLQLDHIDGNHQNNSLENLRIICPNCHTQTDTFSSRKGPRGFRSINSVELSEVEELVGRGLKLAELIRKLNLNPRNMPARQKLKDLVERLRSQEDGL